MSTFEEEKRNKEAMEKLWAKRQPKVSHEIANQLEIRLASFDPNEQGPRGFVARDEFLRRILGMYGQNIPPTAGLSREDRLEAIEEEVTDLKERVDFMESTNKAVYLESNWFEVIAELSSLYSPLGYVKEIYATKNDGLCDLLVILDSESPESAQQEVLTRTFALERRFPKCDFDYIIARRGEVDGADLSRRILLYSRR